MKKTKNILIIDRLLGLDTAIYMLKQIENLNIDIAKDVPELLSLKKKWEKEENLKNGLAHYHLITMNPIFPSLPLYSLKKSDNFLKTGCLLYNDFMRELPALKIVVIWTLYPNQYPDMVWGDNAILERCDYDDPNYLINLARMFIVYF